MSASPSVVSVGTVQAISSGNVSKGQKKSKKTNKKEKEKENRKEERKKAENEEQTRERVCARVCTCCAVCVTVIARVAPRKKRRKQRPVGLVSRVFSVSRTDVTRVQSWCNGGTNSGARTVRRTRGIALVFA